MKGSAFPIALIALTVWTGCKHKQAEDSEVTTFVLSDTMLASITIDTTVVRPVENELRLRGKVMRQGNDVWIMVSLPENVMACVTDGGTADISTGSHPDKVFHGRINKASGDTAIRIRPDAPLKPGTYADVLLRYHEGSALPAIPSSAVISDKGKNFVMVFRDKFNIDTREIKVAKALHETSYIRGGLRAGERIISRNQLQIYDALKE
ncbi:MAG: efflux RND transporter periplasmic adaptor subunit [Chitinophaga sp.]